MYCGANIERETVESPESLDVNDLETKHHFLFGIKNVCLPYLPCADEFVDHRKLFRQTQVYASFISHIFCKEY